MNMQCDHEKLAILDPLLSKFIDLGLYPVTLQDGKTDLQEFVTLYLFGGKWIKIYDNGNFKCSDQALTHLLTLEMYKSIAPPKATHDGLETLRNLKPVIKES